MAVKSKDDTAARVAAELTSAWATRAAATNPDDAFVEVLKTYARMYNQARIQMDKA